MTHITDSIDASFSVKWTHRVRFTNAAFAQDGALDELLLTLQPKQIIVFIDSGLANAHEQCKLNVLQWCTKTPEVCCNPIEITGGESAKNDSTSVKTVLHAIHDNSICRKCCILVMGGGAVLDAVGFASSIAHRGIPIIRLPSTTLSQGDSGIGVKNGINYFGKKNFIGVFDPPFGVINDFSLLKTLDDVHWRSGLSEAIKVALIKDLSLFEFIEEHVDNLIDRDLSIMSVIVQRSATLHLQHIVDGGDPFERLTARPLDFGHWAAHKLEQLTHYNLTHGDAVSIGLAIDVMCSVQLGHLDSENADRIISLLQRLGFPTNHVDLSNTELFDGIEEFRQHLGGELTLLMLKGIEKPFNIHRLDLDVVRQAIDKLM